MRVALVTPYPVDLMRIPGGVRSVAYHLAQGLRRFPDLDIHVLHCHSEVPENRVEIDGNLTVHYMAMSKRRIVPNTIMAVRRVAKALCRLQPDVVNAHAPHYAVAALRSGYPTIYTIHGVTHREAAIYREHLFDRMRFAVELYYARRAVQGVQHLVAISPYVMDEYKDRTRAQWHRIDNPLSDDFFAVEGREVSGRILFVGSITEVKDLLTLLQAVAVMRHEQPALPLSVHLAGRTTSPRYEQRLKDYILEHNLAAVVTFSGMLDMRSLLQEYAECAVLALPSLQENAPMAIIEAMAAGKPVVATKVGGIPDLVDDGETGFLVEAGDFMKMAQRLAMLLTDAALRHYMGDLARRKATARFRLQEVACKYRELYYFVAGQTLPPFDGST
nr:glycosyltransferase family 4 protein [Chloroflexota bacterium]